MHHLAHKSPVHWISTLGSETLGFMLVTTVYITYVHVCMYVHSAIEMTVLSAPFTIIALGHAKLIPCSTKHQGNERQVEKNLKN